MKLSVRLGLSIFLLLAPACGGGGGGRTTVDPADLVLLDVSVGGRDGVALNEVVEFTFSEPVDPDSVGPDTIWIREGADFGRQVPGHFRVGRPEQGEDDRLVLFHPRLPTQADLSDGGLSPDRPYRIFLPSAPEAARTVESIHGDPLLGNALAVFRTAATGDSGLFVDNFEDPAPPRVRFTHPVDGAAGVTADTEILLVFNRRPLHPATVHAGSVRLTMVRHRGEPVLRPVEGEPVVAQSRDSVVVRFVPRFPLADEATYRLSWSHTLTDLSGRSVAPTEDRYSVEFAIRDEPTREAEFTLEFTGDEAKEYADLAETNASWGEAIPGALSAIPAELGGTGRSGVLVADVDLDLSPSSWAGVEEVEEEGVTYDAYHFRRFEIDEGVTVRVRGGESDHPVILHSLEPIRIGGTLSLCGGDGGDGESYPGYTYRRNSAKLGGRAGPGGGDGAASYAGPLYEDVPVGDGDDAPEGAEGGAGGCAGNEVTSTYNRSNGGGGGGGGARTAGQPGGNANYSVSASNGAGGLGGAAEPGNQERVPSVGGAGGGAGGLGFNYRSGNVQIHRPGGGGGGGGGAVRLRCLGTLTIGRAGRILADGGDGGGTGGGSGSFHGGGGGGGGGGTVKLEATKGVRFEPGARISVVGGDGGDWQANTNLYVGGAGGRGGDGFIRIQCPDPSDVRGTEGAELSGPPSIGELALTQPGLASIGQSRFVNLGVFDPVLVGHGLLATRFNGDIEVEVQMAAEDPLKPGSPWLEPGTAHHASPSEWTPLGELASLNGRGYRFLRVRVRFRLDAAHSLSDPLPYVERLSIRFEF